VANNENMKDNGVMKMKRKSASIVMKSENNVNINMEIMKMSKIIIAALQRNGVASKNMAPEKPAWRKAIQWRNLCSSAKAKLPSM
jgi:hypothetical protein